MHILVQKQRELRGAVFYFIPSNAKNMKIIKRVMGLENNSHRCNVASNGESEQINFVKMN